MAVNTALRDYLLTRRSIGMAFLKDPGPSAAELQEMLTIATRVPDHGKYAPWRLVIIEGDARREIGEKLAEIQRRRNPALDEASLDIERNRLLPAPLTVGVILSPKPNTKAPEQEQLLSAGNVCFNLLHAAFALGYAADWVTRWYTFDPEAQQMLGARGGERFVGFVHIGSTDLKPEDRVRPALEDVASRWQG